MGVKRENGKREEEKLGKETGLGYATDRSGTGNDLKLLDASVSILIRPPCSAGFCTRHFHRERKQSGLTPTVSAAVWMRLREKDRGC